MNILKKIFDFLFKTPKLKIYLIYWVDIDFNDNIVIEAWTSHSKAYKRYKTLTKQLKTAEDYNGNQRYEVCPIVLNQKQ